ncbi:MAG: polysaccharide deacetylase family protein [Pseudomonadales bacterium]
MIDQSGKTIRLMGETHHLSVITWVRNNAVRALVSLMLLGTQVAAWGETYAQKLGWPEGSRVLILHVDDAGMSHESNQGAWRAIRNGVANSVSVMMPTPWVPEFAQILKAHPEIDAGLHLTLNAEWNQYRWGPLAGKPAVPSLVDQEGALWATVEEVMQHGTVAHVAQEIAAQLERARTMGFEPTHLDSHMGTLFATPEFLQSYIELGVKHQIPIMFPGGHNFYAQQDYGERAAAAAVATGEQIWAAGLPVLDDLHNSSYGWVREEKIRRYVEAIRELRPGVTMMIMHCSTESENFQHISTSGPSRYGDLDAMLSPEVANALMEEQIILTTWRELMERRQALGK